jgi:hypothetical protein
MYAYVYIYMLICIYAQIHIGYLNIYFYCDSGRIPKKNESEVLK